MPGVVFTCEAVWMIAARPRADRTLNAEGAWSRCLAI